MKVVDVSYTSTLFLICTLLTIFYLLYIYIFEHGTDCHVTHNVENLSTRLPSSSSGWSTTTKAFPGITQIISDLKQIRVHTVCILRVEEILSSSVRTGRGVFWLPEGWKILSSGKHEFLVNERERGKKQGGRCGEREIERQSVRDRMTDLLW